MTISQRPQVSCILADLDDTCYENTAMQHHVADNIRRYMAERLEIPADEVAEKCADYYLNYGTTLAGLVAHGHKIDYDDWHASVHGSLPYEQYLKPDPTLKRLLDSIPLPKYIFTNADIKHADRCLALLGIADCFDGVIAFEQVMQAAEEAGVVHHGCPVVCKPNRQSFDIALRLAGGAQASTTLWLDDSARNITTGHRMGLYSVLVGRTQVACPSDAQIRHIHELPAVLPWLWQPGQQPPVTEVAAEEEEQREGVEEEAVATLSQIAQKKAAAIKAGASSGGEAERVEAIHVAA